MKHLLVAILFTLPALQGCAHLGSAEVALPTPSEVAALLSENALEVSPLGSYERQVSGASEVAQSWFDQGVRYTYGFNQDQAAACYARAAVASPECAMAWWGISQICSGVDINNAEVTEDEAIWGLVAAQEAQRLAPMTTPLEQALIEASSLRAVIPMPGPMDRADLDNAYRVAMAKIWKENPTDPDVGTLYAESIMSCQPWDYWTNDYEPVERTEEIVALLETCMTMAPHHPGAHHFYIHMVESSGKAERGIPSADLLGELPGSGHLRHMPSHIYANVGRYADAVKVNEEAVRLDDAYFSAYEKPTFYMNYYAHNIQFVVFGAMMEGRKELSFAYIDKLEALVTDEVIEMFASIADGMNAMRLHNYIRFGMWDEILAFPDYAEFRKASRTMRHYARTVAFANSGRTAEARLELAQFDLAAADTPEDWMVAFNSCEVVFGIARKVAEAEIYWREGDAAKAISMLKEACEEEHGLTYTEPPAWLIPIRHALGAIQLASGDALGAEQTYREDLEKHKGNGWSLLGLYQSLEKQGKLEAALALKSQVDMAWGRADIEAPASCYCGVELTIAK
jgi:tetratricopeptide (TPR) repeat protein